MEGWEKVGLELKEEVLGLQEEVLRMYYRLDYSHLLGHILCRFGSRLRTSGSGPPRKARTGWWQR